MILVLVVVSTRHLEVAAIEAILGMSDALVSCLLIEPFREPVPHQQKAVTWSCGRQIKFDLPTAISACGKVVLVGELQQTWRDPQSGLSKLFLTAQLGAVRDGSIPQHSRRIHPIAALPRE
jgi:hypothetical protein